MQKEGELGRRKITQWTRYLTVGLALMQSFGSRRRSKPRNKGLVMNPGFGFMAMTILSLTTGTAFIMWLGEQITERGIGNGMSLLIFTGIIVRLPEAIVELVQKVQTGDWPLIQVAVILVMMVAVVAFIVLVERGERRIPVQYAKRVIGRRVMGGQSTHLPLKVNAGGVIPVIFASSLLAFPSTLMNVDWVRKSPVMSGMLGAIRGTAHRCITCCTRRSSSFSASSTFRSFSIRTKRPTICASMAALFRDPAGKEHRRLHEQDSDQDYGGGRPVSCRSCR